MTLLASIDPIVRFASLIFVIFTIALSVVLFLPRIKETAGYRSTMKIMRPLLPYIGWLLTIMGGIWAVWGFFQSGDVKLLVGLGIILSILGIHLIKIGYEDEDADRINATNLKVVSLCMTFTLAFLFLLLYGRNVAQIF